MWMFQVTWHHWRKNSSSNWCTSRLASLLSRISHLEDLPWLTWQYRLCFWRNVSSIYALIQNKSTSALWKYQARRRNFCSGRRWCSNYCLSCPCFVSFERYFSFSAWRTQLQLRFGPAPKNSDSAINILLDVVQDQSGKTYKMDHYATRHPTNVIDIADFLVRLTGNIPHSHYSLLATIFKFEFQR